MNLELLFSMASMTAMIGWALLIFLPKTKLTEFLVHRGLLPALLSLAYVVLIVPGLLTSEGGFNSLESVRVLFLDPRLLLGGWVHYLAFDLVVGSWIAKKMQAISVPHLAVIPVLLLTFMIGPAGYLVALTIERIKGANPD